MTNDPTGEDVYISRVYESEQDDRHKFTVITRVRNGERVLGLLGASVAVDARMVALDMRRELPGARLVGPLDLNSRSQISTTQAPSFVVVLDRNYDVAGQKPITVTRRESAMFESFAANTALTEASDLLDTNGNYVNYVRVGDSQFVVLAEHPYPWPLAWVVRQPLILGGGLALAVGVLALFQRARLWARRRIAAL
jgi:hypothetical protein